MQVHGLTFWDWSPSYAHICIIFGRYEDGQVGDANINTQDPKIQKEIMRVIGTQVYTNWGGPSPRTTPVPPGSICPHKRAQEQQTSLPWGIKGPLLRGRKKIDEAAFMVEIDPGTTPHLDGPDWLLTPIFPVDFTLFVNKTIKWKVLWTGYEKKKRIQCIILTTYKICINRPVMLSVKLPINIRLSAVKFGESIVIHRFLTAQRGQHTALKKSSILSSNNLKWNKENNSVYNSIKKK